MAVLKVSLKLLFSMHSNQASLGPYAWEKMYPLPSRSSGEFSAQCQGIPKKHKCEDLEINSLPRSQDVFARIYSDPCITCRLPTPGSTAGAVLRHAVTVFESLHARQQPMTFKFGFTHDAHFRWRNAKFGYTGSAEKFEHMIVLFAACHADGPAFLEAALIHHFGSCVSIMLNPIATKNAVSSKCYSLCVKACNTRLGVAKVCLVARTLDLAGTQCPKMLTDHSSPMLCSGVSNFHLTGQGLQR